MYIYIYIHTYIIHIPIRIYIYKTLSGPASSGTPDSWCASPAGLASGHRLPTHGLWREPRIRVRFMSHTPYVTHELAGEASRGTPRVKQRRPARSTAWRDLRGRTCSRRRILRTAWCSRSCSGNTGRASVRRPKSAQWAGFRGSLTNASLTEVPRISMVPFMAPDLTFCHTHHEIY